MTDPQYQDIYVMQNEFGCIKIGRSVDAWQRLAQLRATEHCHIEIVAVFEGGGEYEESIHENLDSFRLEGEWFSGAEAARKAIEAVFEPNELTWATTFDAAAAQAWLQHLKLARRNSYIRKVILREITILKSVREPNSLSDSSVLWCIQLAKTGERPFIGGKMHDGKMIRVWFPDNAPDGQPIPAFTRDMETALTAWPEHSRPISFDGSAIDCCVAALTAIRDALPRVPRYSAVVG